MGEPRGTDALGLKGASSYTSTAPGYPINSDVDTQLEIRAGLVRRWGQVGVSVRDPALQAVLSQGTTAAMQAEVDVQELSLRDFLVGAADGVQSWELLASVYDNPELVEACFRHFGTRLPSRLRSDSFKGVVSAGAAHVGMPLHLNQLDMIFQLWGTRRMYLIDADGNASAAMLNINHEAFFFHPAKWSSATREAVREYGFTCVLLPSDFLVLQPSIWYLAYVNLAAHFSFGALSEHAHETSVVLGHRNAVLHPLGWVSAGVKAASALRTASVSRSREAARLRLRAIFGSIEAARRAGLLSETTAGNLNAHLLVRLRPPTRPSAPEAHEEDPQQRTIAITSWSGRVGNNLLQLANALIVARRIGAVSVRTPQGGAVRELFDLPTVLSVGTDLQSLRRGCPGASAISGTWLLRQPCPFVSVQERRDALRQFVLPWMNSELARCVRRSRRSSQTQTCAASCKNASIDLGPELVVHLRGGDIFDDAHVHQQHRQPPCALYQRIFADGIRGIPFKKVIVVTERWQKRRRSNHGRNLGNRTPLVDREHPCLQHLFRLKQSNFASDQLEHGDLRSSLAYTHQPTIEFSVGSLLEDACALLRARHIVVSFSTFSGALALMSSAVQRIYGCPLPPLIDCHIGAGVEFVEYDVPGLEQYRLDVADNRRWMMHYDGGNIVSKQPC
eukprot:TRINITY_DN21053_c0_g1_i1.p1 TRINITY_DN21053_c0_g1~~TRINITY_DN21053_c0_g1_i1.p1  ORF type:complete len:675 (-),score=30.28 TRINITY_DN21053_c0_g1_i1:94-2118(-)